MTEELATSNNDVLKQQGFNKLLDWLDLEREKAALKYEQIRLQLIRFFQFNDCPCPEDCADDVIQRVTKKLEEGLEIRATEPFVYFRAVARNRLLEYWRNHQRRQHITLDDMPASSQPFINPEDINLQQKMQEDKERAIKCLPKCLDELPDESSKLFLKYHQNNGGDHISLRLQLAKELGLEINALRSRITRIRDKLEKCIQHCMQK